MKRHDSLQNTGDCAVQRLMTWYGISAEVVIEGDYWHWVRLGSLPIPHPPVINRFLRRHLTRAEKQCLSYWHEVGHLQTVPWALLLAGVYVGLLWWRVHTGGAVFFRGLAAVIGHEAIWELMAEGYVLVHMGRRYLQIYQRWGIIMLVGPFYLGMMLLAGITTWYVMWG